MTAALQLSSVPTTQIARLRQFLTWFLVAAVLATILQWIGAALAGSLAITLTGVVTGCMSITTLFAQSQLSHNKLNRAILLTCASFCVASIAMLAIIPLLLPVMILGPTIALAIALPYVDSRTLKRMSIVTWLVVMAQAILAQVIIPLENLAPLLSSSLMVVLMCIAFPLLLLLLWQFHNRLTETLTQTQAANLSLQIAVTSAEKARAQAEQANELKSQFLANMSHELRTPLNSIINFTRILSTGMRGPVNVEQLDYLQRVRQSGEHLLGLINDILDLSKIEAGRMELYTETLHIPDLVQGVLATVAGLTKGKPIELLQELEANLPPIKADRTRIRQVLLNLLSNAAKFTDAGTITVGATCHDGQLIMRVTDTGIGIAQADLETVFEEFRQVEADTNRRYEGTGLGLAICRRLIEIHGGRIWVESTLGVGSTFAFSLPALPAASPAPRETIITTNGTGIPVLVIDDDPAAIEIVAAYLERDGYTVYGITDSRRAIEEAQVIKPAVIILDVLMPHKDGWELLAEIKANPALRDLPVVLYTIVDEQKLGFYLGASAYLTKPVDAEKLRATVTQLAKGDATILVIDDDPNAREIVTQQLEVGGSYRVRSASGGQDGLNQIASAAPDLIILDLMMPEIDGFAVLDQLDLNPHTRAIPVIVLTAKSLDPQEHDMLNRRVKGLLAKGGTDAEQLLSKVNALVGTINSL